MNVYLLPGNSPQHKAWSEYVRDELMSRGLSVLIQYYQHWDTGEPLADVAYELDVARKQTASLSPYVIVAKSTGTVIAMQGMSDRVLLPEKLVLLGVPLRGVASQVPFKKWLETTPVPIEIIQNSHDPYGSYKQTHDLAWGVARVTTREMPGDTHDYNDIDAIVSAIDNIQN